MARARPATAITISLGRRLLRYELRVGNLGITFKGRASEPVEVELRDLSQVTDPFATSDVREIERQITDQVVEGIRRYAPVKAAVVKALDVPRAKRTRRKAVRRG